MINRAVKRNPDRFPEEFYFSLTAKEAATVSTKSQESLPPSLTSIIHMTNEICVLNLRKSE